MTKLVLYTLKEAAEQTRLHVGTIRKGLTEGRFDAMKVGRDWLFTPTQVEELKRTAKPQKKRGTNR